MKIRLGNRSNFGSVLFITLVLAGLLGVALGSYLYWVRSQNLLTTESHAWNGALVIAEAGVEEAMAQINTKFGTNGNFAANGWGFSGGIYGPPNGGVPRVLKAGLVTNGTYSAIITRDSAGYPLIYSTGYTTVPLVGRVITRVVEVRTATSPAFAGAMAALQDINFSGNTIAVDSYDSNDPAHSTTNGMYNPATRKANGDVASPFGTVNVGNANINGHVRTGPNGNYTTGPNGYAGDLGWTGPGVQPGWYTKDFNADFKDASLPDDFVSPVGMMVGVTNTWVMGTGDYQYNGTLRLQSSDNIYVAGNARLYVTGSIDMKSTTYITIGSGATLTVYCAGPSAVFSQVNTIGNANTFKYFGLPTNTSLSWSGNAQYVGTVYAPEATFTLGGGGNNVMDYQGACVVKSVVLNGKFSFHFDEDLKRHGPMSGFQMKSWLEVMR
jgi:hypothetical protein